MFASARTSLVDRAPAFAAATVSGIGYCVSFCGYDQWYLAWLCLAPVIYYLDDATLTAREAAALGWVTGAMAHLGVYTWIINMLRDFAFMPLPVALVVYAILCVAQSSLFAAWAFGTHAIVREGKVPLVWAAPIMLVLADWLYPALFPSYFANSQYKQIWLIQSCGIWGILGITFLLTLASSVMAAWARERRPIYATVTLVGLLVGSGLYGYGEIADLDDTLSHSDRRIRVGMVQTNMGIYEKFEHPDEGLRRHRNQSLELQDQGAELIIWPESGYNYAIDTTTKNVKGQVLGALKTPLLFGGLRIDRGKQGRQIYNTAFMASGEGEVLGTYDKIYLLAFGEYLPFGEWLPFLYKLSPQTSHFDFGVHTNPLVWNGVRFGTLICYEDILPAFVRKVMKHKPDVLVNLTNDAWFGKTTEPRIHMALSVFRAVEQRRFLIRSTNTGISAFIDPAGRILQETPVFARANLIGDVVPMRGLTIYQRLGDWPGFVCLGLTAYWLRKRARTAWSTIRAPS